MENKALPRNFGFWTGWFVVVASMIGSGILTNSGPILRSTGSYSALLLLWTFGGFLALTGALTMGELASGITRAGGDYAYVRAAFGPAWGFVYGWAMVLLGFAAPIAVVAYTNASFVYPLFKNAFPTSTVPISLFAPAGATILIAVLTIAHSFGQRSSALVQGLTTLLKFAVLFGFTFLGLHATGGSWAHWHESVPLTQVSFGKLSTGLILVMYAYSGWNAASYLSGETRDAERLVPRCLTFGALAVLGTYLLVNVFYIYAFSIEEVRALGESDISRFAQIAISKLLGDNVGRVFSFLFCVEVFSSLSAYILTGPRVVYAMAEDGLCPKVAGRLHPQTGSPVLATILQSLAALIFLWSGTFEQILEFTSYGLASISMLLIAPIFVLRKRPDFQPRFRVPFYPWTPLFFLVTSVLLILGGAIDRPWNASISIFSLLASFPLYFAWKKFSA